MICSVGFEYLAEAIKDKKRYYYRVDDVTVEITKYEYDKVMVNPYLYYFSTALKLHHRILRLKNKYTQAWQK